MIPRNKVIPGDFARIFRPGYQHPLHDPIVFIPELDVDTISSAVVSGLSLSWPHTCNGLYRGLIVGISHSGPSNSNLVTGVTYNGVAMTLIGGIDVTGGGNRTEQWKLSNPDSGAHDIVVTMDGGNEIAAGGVSFVGANQVTANLTGAQATADGVDPGPITVDVASAVGEIVIDCATNTGTNFVAAGAGQTSRWVRGPNNGDGSGVDGACSTEDGAATVTMSWTIGAEQFWGIAGVSVKPY